MALHEQSVIIFQRPLDATSAQYTTQVDVDQLFLLWNDRVCFRRCSLYHSMVYFSDDPLATRIKSRYNVLFPCIALPLFFLPRYCEHRSLAGHESRCCSFLRCAACACRSCNSDTQSARRTACDLLHLSTHTVCGA